MSPPSRAKKKIVPSMAAQLRTLDRWPDTSTAVRQVLSSAPPVQLCQTQAQTEAEMQASPTDLPDTPNAMRVSIDGASCEAMMPPAKLASIDSSDRLGYGVAPNPADAATTEHTHAQYVQHGDTLVLHSSPTFGKRQPTKTSPHRKHAQQRAVMPSGPRLRSANSRHRR